MGYAASTTAGGMCSAYPDVCNVPSASGTTPTTFTNTAQCSNATDTTNQVKIENSAVIHKGSSMQSSEGDESGTSGGLVSGVNMGKVEFKDYSSKVRVEGDYIVMHMKTTGQNGSSANAVGSQVSSSQNTVYIGQ